jgi:hypothetical protein
MLGGGLTWDRRSSGDDEEDLDMTDTLQATPGAPTVEDADDPGCGCCVRPPSAATAKIAQLEVQRAALERRLQELADVRD